jgi:hypothetical protein
MMEIWCMEPSSGERSIVPPLADEKDSATRATCWKFIFILKA